MKAAKDFFTFCSRCILAFEIFMLPHKKMPSQCGSPF